ncbi:porin [Methylopila sp. M107]|uniref:porin n=1 Tax=Methylopila sp. M107 TaxID=1101190 RepID=UPI00035D43AB|nr:porin [Methylopila sp. M107]
MKLVKSLALGSAAALMTMTGAQAADLPGAEPVDYVKVCDVKGSTGFFYIPGTDTCLQVGGFARLEVTSGEILDPRVATTGLSNGLKAKDEVNRTGYRVRARVWFDARTETEYGTVRTFVRLQLQRETGAAGQAARISNGLTGLDADDSLFDQAFVQFAGLTAGVTDSFWDFKPYPTFQNPFISDRTVPVIAYTAKIGDFSASIGLEDATARYRNDTNGFRNTGQEIPDIVANVRVKQGWGEAQISGVAHRINPKSDNGFRVGPPAVTPVGSLAGENSITGDSEWGWGVQAGLKLNLPTANTSDQKGDFIWGQVGYIDGAGLSYVGIGDQNVGSGTTQNIAGFNPVRDYLLVDGKTQKTQAFNANLGVLHYWSPQWRSALQATYIDVNYKKINADWATGAVTGNLIWSPVKKLDIGAELVYIKNLDKAKIGYTGPKDNDAFVGRLRVQRDF